VGGGGKKTQKRGLCKREAYANQTTDGQTILEGGELTKMWCVALREEKNKGRERKRSQHTNIIFAVEQKTDGTRAYTPFGT